MATSTTKTRICVFCSSVNGADPGVPEVARRLAQLMHKNDMILIYGGGMGGLMGALARERVRLGGVKSVIGISAMSVLDTDREISAPKVKKNKTTGQSNNKAAELRDLLSAIEGGQAVDSSKAGDGDKMLAISSMIKKLFGISDDAKPSSDAPKSKLAPGWRGLVDAEDDSVYGQHVITPALAVRKALMRDFIKKGGPGSGFISLPGGFGSLAEVLEVLDYRQRGTHNGQMVLCNINGAWNGFEQWMDDAEKQGFLRSGNKRMVDIVESPEDAINVFLEQRKKAEWRLRATDQV